MFNFESHARGHIRNNEYNTLLLRMQLGAYNVVSNILEVEEVTPLLLNHNYLKMSELDGWSEN